VAASLLIHGETRNLPKQVNPAVVATPGQGGAGFDVTQHDALRRAVRQAINQASWGATVNVSMTAIAQALYPSGFVHAWQAVTCVENHDIVKTGDENRIPVLADGSNHRSWYARSRSRVATALVNHYLFEPVACTPAAGREKGQVENQVGNIQEWLFTPQAKFDSLVELNVWLAQRKHPALRSQTIANCFASGARLCDSVQSFRISCSMDFFSASGSVVKAGRVAFLASRSSKN